MKQIIALLVALIVLSPATLAQTRKRTTSKPTRRSSSSSQRSGEAVREGATHIADQIKVLTHFLYLLGGVAKGLEAADAAARRSEASPSILEQTERSKETVRTSLQGVREGLDKLELEFRTTPALIHYYLELTGVSSSAATAEDQAAANQFDRAGRTLLDVVNRLTDVLLEMK